MLYLKLFTFSLFYYCECYNILGVCHIPTGSHQKLAIKLFSEIAKRGHEVTLVTSQRIESKVKNLKIITVEELINIVNGSVVSFETDNSPLSIYLKAQTLSQYLVEYLLQHHKIQNFLKSNETFDAVIVWQYMNGALYNFAHHFKCPLILFSTIPLFSDDSFLLSQPGFPSYIPNVYSGFTGHMNFWQRLKNTYYDVVMIMYHFWYVALKQQEFIGRYFPESLDLSSLYRNVSLLLMNTDVSTNRITPQAPNVVEIGGFHIDEPKPLPDDLQNFLDQSPNGVIIFSMGSLLKSANFSDGKRNAIIRTFSQLKESVLWKHESEEIEELPKNVKVMKWLPQVDLLAHPNVKAFISHGGIMSTMESVYFAKPIVGIPFIIDQAMNIAIAASNGYAVQIPYKELTEEKLKWALNEILNNSKYQNSAKKLSLTMRNRSVKPIEAALFWIEYVIRYKGNPYKFMAVDPEWYSGSTVFTTCVVTYVSTTSIYILLTK